MILGYFDYILIGILIVFNSIFWKTSIKQKIGCIIGVLLFGLLFPLTSLAIEVQRVKTTIGIIDNFEILYPFFRFPIYWLIGIIQLFIIEVNSKKTPNK